MENLIRKTKGSGREEIGAVNGGLGNGEAVCLDCLRRNLSGTGNSGNSVDPAGIGRAVWYELSALASSRAAVD